jgi:hypothetical protein
LSQSAYYIIVLRTIAQIHRCYEEEKDDERVNIKCLVVELSNPSRMDFVTQRMAMFSGIIAQDATDFRISDCVKSQHAGTSLFLHSHLALFLWSDRSGSVSYLKILNVTL